MGDDYEPGSTYKVRMNANILANKRAKRTAEMRALGRDRKKLIHCHKIHY